MPDTLPMPFQATRHPEALRNLIVEHGQRMTGVAIHRALAAGTLDGWDGPYLIPKETCCLYIREAKKAAARTTAVDQLEQGLNAAIYTSATELYRLTALKVQKLNELGSKAPADQIDDVVRVLERLAKLAPLKPSGTASNPTQRGEDAAATRDPILSAIAAQKPVHDSDTLPNTAGQREHRDTQHASMRNHNDTEQTTVPISGPSAY